MTLDKPMSPSRKLAAIKAFHTLVWAFFAGCILAIPFAVYFTRLRMAGVLIAIVLVEVMVIAFNRGRCPLTAVAARYTQDRADNFDIFLPVWLARYNKAIFGSLFVGALVYTLIVWARNQGV
ncbi:hypothetical protein [Pseudoxanthomonas wuyuanensis]|uniref:DUF2784 domain-containing protein n=1 Tax=Pseudoxanthomonas wuyuanensis TaxID=1073196 RepID=A0A286D3D3_9GAMM|nr:hypothetical protein [Pseudoxanthomonas wuyuanensis]KAF1722974.1 hypothetical protein CSC75_00335 [Pseudoxanthomonas wuyuanensis]SOD53161.1 hypothetical protein SAMN06296416_102269 [Pseudoxanthomonas wuyuanensis]